MTWPRLRDLLKCPRVTVIHNEALVATTAVMMLFLVIFGSHRRRSRHWFIQKGVSGAYALSFSLATYAAGSMQSAQVKSGMYPVWATSLVVLFGCANSITAYSLDDNNQITSQLFLYMAYLMLMSINFPVVCGYLWQIALHQCMHRLRASELASNLNKMVADYMYQEHILSRSEECDPVGMTGYRYLVDWPLRKSKLEAGTSYKTQLTADAAQVIDIEKIWLCSGRSLSPELKDACLSFSLFHLLRRRFFGFACAESTQQKTHDFVFKGLLMSKKSEGGATQTADYDRAFRVIEVELAFMYDFFFTKHAALYYASGASTFWSWASASLILCVAANAWTYSSMDGSVAVNITTADVVITELILASIALLELLQPLLYWATIWGRVSFVCQYLRRKSCCMMRFRELISKIGVYFASNLHYWQHKLGQYSLIESVSYTHHPWTEEPEVSKRLLCILKFCNLSDEALIHPRPGKDRVSRVCRKLGKPIKLPSKVKEAIALSLKRTDGKLTNGESSLVSNGAGHLSWACAQGMHSSDSSCSQSEENQANHILTWHIATCYCEMATLKYLSPKKGTQLQFNLDVATNLSKYCAYLIGSAPRLLPGHHYDTKRVFHAVAGEAMKFLQNERDKYEAMTSLPESTETTFQRGVKLGRQLEDMALGARWKVLADFWAEVMLYVAPSDNVKEHMECLAKGGEFVTHLWALLSHAGILKREEHQVGSV